MNDVLMFILSTAGLAHGVVTSSLLEPLRAALAARSPKLGELVNCHQCSGFWAGALVGLSITWNPLHLVMLGGAGSASALLLKYILIWLEANSLVEVEA